MTKITLPIDGASATTATDVSAHSRVKGFAVQFNGIAGGGTYKIQASLDGGTTWLDITKSFVNLNTGVAFAGDVAANTIAVSTAPIPGVLRFLSTAVGTGGPTALVGSNGLT